MAKRTRSAAERAAQAESLRARPARGRMLAAARELATTHGYEQVRVGELADLAGVSRETFYTHFADKRACLAEAMAPRLGEVEQLLRIATEEGEDWAGPILASVDEQLSRRFDSEQGPRARILAAIVELASEHGFASVRLADLVKAAHVSYPSFYRCFESKEQCFEVARAELVERLGDRVVAAAELADEASQAAPSGALQLRALAETLSGERDIARVLLLEGAIPAEEGGHELTGAGSSPLTGLIARLASEASADDRDDDAANGTRAHGGAIPNQSMRMLSGALVEAMRTELLAGEVDEITTTVDALLGALTSGNQSRPRPSSSGRRRMERGRPGTPRRKARSAAAA